MATRVSRRIIRIARHNGESRKRLRTARSACGIAVVFGLAHDDYAGKFACVRQWVKTEEN